MPALIKSATTQTIKVGITFCLSGRLRRTKKPSKKVPTAHTHTPTVSVIQKIPTINNSQRTPLENSYVLFVEAGKIVEGRASDVGGRGIEIGHAAYIVVATALWLYFMRKLVLCN